MAADAVAGFGGPKVLHTTDAGRSWRDATGDLPDFPAHSVAVDPNESGEAPRLWVGTDQGVWVSLDGGASWREHGDGLPHAPVTDLRFDPIHERLVVATQGRGLWEAPARRG